MVGQLQQQMEAPDPRTYIGPGKLKELRSAIAATGAETVIFDDELSPRVARALEQALPDGVRLCDRTALILDIFSQRAASHEGHLQVRHEGRCYWKCRVIGSGPPSGLESQALGFGQWLQLRCKNADDADKWHYICS